MTASKDLVARLRENAQDDLAAADCPHVCREAADRIEALEAALRDARALIASHYPLTGGVGSYPQIVRIDALIGDRT